MLYQDSGDNKGKFPISSLGGRKGLWPSWGCATHKSRHGSGRKASGSAVSIWAAGCQLSPPAPRGTFRMVWLEACQRSVSILEAITKQKLQAGPGQSTGAEQGGVQARGGGAGLPGNLPEAQRGPGLGPTPPSPVPSGLRGLPTSRLKWVLARAGMKPAQGTAAQPRDAPCPRALAPRGRGHHHPGP